MDGFGRVYVFASKTARFVSKTARGRTLIFSCFGVFLRRKKTCNFRYVDWQALGAARDLGVARSASGAKIAVFFIDFCMVFIVDDFDGFSQI